MSAWVIGLGLAIGYLVNKNHKVTSRIDDAVATYQNGHSANGTTGGSTSVEIEAAKNTPYNMAVRCSDINELISGADMAEIKSAQANNAAAVHAYDSAPSPPEIIGVMLQVGV